MPGSAQLSDAPGQDTAKPSSRLLLHLFLPACRGLRAASFNGTGIRASLRLSTCSHLTGKTHAMKPHACSHAGAAVPSLASLPSHSRSRKPHISVGAFKRQALSWAVALAAVTVTSTLPLGQSQTWRREMLKSRPCQPGPTACNGTTLDSPTQTRLARCGQAGALKCTPCLENASAAHGLLRGAAAPRHDAALTRRPRAPAPACPPLPWTGRW